MEQQVSVPKAAVRGDGRVAALLSVIAGIVLVLPSQLALNTPWLSLVDVGVGLFVVSAVLMILVFRFRVPGFVTHYLMFACVLCALGAISALANGWTYPLIVYGSFAAVLGTVMCTFTSLSNPTAAVRILVKTVAFTTAAIIAVSLLREGFSMHRYQGIFNNPNSLGWVAASALSLFLGALLAGIITSRRQRIALIVLSSVLVLLLLASQARAATVAVLVGAAAVFLPTFWRAITVHRISETYARRALLVLAIAFVGLLVAGAMGLLEPILGKFAANAGRGDLLSGRSDAWAAMINRVTLLGLGPNYAEAIGRAGQKVGHNVYLSQMSRYGLLPAVAFLGMLLHIWWRAFRRALSSGRGLPRVLLCVLSAFLVQSAFSTASASPGIWLSLLLFGGMMSERGSSQKGLCEE